MKSTVNACEQCQLRLPSQQREPLEWDPRPTRPFEEVAADFFSIGGNHFLAITDRYSGWPVLFHFKHPPTAAKTIQNLRQLFCSIGCPTRIFTDGGLPFTAAETQDFFVRWGIRHRLSTPENPQSNGLAESAVKALKNLLCKSGGTVTESFCEGLLELCNTPKAGGKSPSEIVYGHALRSRVPAHHRAFDQKWQVSMDQHDIKIAALHAKAVAAYDATSKTLPPIPMGSHVRIQNSQTKLWDSTGLIVSCGKSCDYRIRLPSGRCLWRNRRYLRPIPTNPQNTTTKAKPKPADEEEIIPILRRSKRNAPKPSRYQNSVIL